MNILFVHDHVLKQNKENQFFTSGGIGGNNIFKKYCSSNNDNLYLYTRVTPSNECNNLINLSTQNKVVCKPSKYYHTPLDYFIKYKKIYNEIDLNNIDKIVLRVPSMLSIVIYHKNKKYKKPYYVEVVGCPWDSLRYHGILGKLLAPFMRLKTKKIIAKAKNVQYVTSSFLQKRYPTTGKSIGCSDVILENNKNNILDFRQKKITKKSNDDKFILCTIGNVDVKYKGQEYVIKAISKLIKEGYNIEYHLIGSGTGNYLKKMTQKYDIEKHIVFCGQMSHENVLKYLTNDVDIYIQPSNVEGLCRSLIEAMNCALPCLASNVGGNPELLKAQYLFKRKDVKQIYNLIKNLISSKKELEKAAKTNYQNSQNYEQNILNERRNKFYNNFITKR